MGMRSMLPRGNGLLIWATAGLSGVMVVGLLAIDATYSSAMAQAISCRGSMNNGWRYTAQYRSGEFTQIRWTRSGQQETTTLTYTSTNAQGQLVYTGAFRANTAVTLVDLSGGNVRSGSQISVYAEEWGWSRGTCGTRPVPAAW